MPRDPAISSVVPGTPESWFGAYDWRVNGTMEGSEWGPVTRAVLDVAYGPNPDKRPSMAWFRTRKGRGYGKYDNKSHGTPHKMNAAEFWTVRKAFMERYGVEYVGVDEAAPPDAEAQQEQARANFAVAASTLCPLLVLGIWWKRATSEGALAGMLAGLAVCLYYMLAPRYIPFTFYETSSFFSNASADESARYAALRQAYYLADEGARAAALASWEETARAIRSCQGTQDGATSASGPGTRSTAPGTGSPSALPGPTKNPTSHS